ncbi:extensin-like [Zingiber officinale]|uniref:Uncharacterized protein n=1 Tax=Zingiber officinale TaxID=94328 RepID=A0A8J5KVM2_ZINOF|nr:extensin-like [Zingiber officinale]KAG6491313.1 hypothetical protein ZIOFF_052651 [Zingiber officinale]
MAAKVDPTNTEPRRAQTSGTMPTSSTVSASSPKVSFFGAKSGFVIPKNKHSGSLVPIFRAGGKSDGSSAKEETAKSVQRKTKWGPDPTLDAAVRKGRVLAYQIRLEQITEQLKSGVLETTDDQSPSSIKQDLDDDSGSHTNGKESSKIQRLKLERREVIGEILRLNPSYKPPSDYKPLLKETDIPIPISAHPGYNVIQLLLGPESNTQKRLEEETGTKIRVYGTKKDTRDKHEVTYSVKTEALDAYEELHVKISADTYEKIDTAVALLELLLTPVSGIAATSSSSLTSPINGDSTKTNLKETASSSMVLGTVDANQGIRRPPMLLPTQPNALQYQRFAAPWPLVGAPNAQQQPISGFMPSLPNTNAHFSALPIGPFGAPSMAVPSTPQLPGGMQQNQNQPPHLHHSGQQPPPYLNMLTHMPPFTTQPTGALPAPTQLLSSQPVPAVPSAAFPGRPLSALPPAGNSGWSQVVPLVQRPLLQPQALPMRPVAVVSSPAVAPVPNAPASIASGTITLPSPVRHLATQFPPAPFPSQPGASFTSITQAGPVSIPSPVPFSSGAPLPTTPSAASSFMPPMLPRPVSMLPGPPAPMPHQIPLPSAPAQSSRPAQLLGSPATPETQPPVVAPRPPRPISGDFTYQPPGAQNLAPLASPRPNIHHVQQMTLPVSALPQPPSFRPALHNSINLQAFPSQANPTQIPMRPPPPPVSPFPVDRTIARPPPSLTVRPNPMAPSFPPGPPQPPNLPGQSVPFVQTSPSQLHPPNRPHPMIPVQQLGGKPPGYVAGMPSNAGGSQIYDPFSPTAISTAPRKAEDNAVSARKPEADSEYEDLMASVGVK